MTDKKLRWGILGCGNIAGQFCVGVAQSRRCVLAAAASREMRSAEAFAKSHRIPVAIGGYDELMNRPDLDAIYIALPNALHKQWAIKALLSGKHVLCEKPIAMTGSDAEEMFDVARRSGRVLVEAFMYRSHPQTLAVIDAIKAGAIGKLQLIRTSFCYRTTRIQGNVRFDPALGGGALMDIGCYCINFSRLFGAAEPTAINGVGRMHETGVDVNGAGVLGFPGGVLAAFSYGMNVQADNTAHLCGDDGYIEIPVPWKPPAGAGTFIITRGTPPKMDKGAAPVAPPPRDVRTVTVNADVYGIEADDFAASVLDGKPPRVSAADTIGNMQVIERLRRQIYPSAD